MLLNVSAPFHSPMMAPAAIVMKDALQAVTMQVPAAPLIANVTAQPVSDVNAIRELLVEQVTGRVRWRETLECLQGQGMPGLLECGHGKVLSGLAKRAERGWPTLSLQNPQDIEIALAG
jgi:[acyl-carrier-protein] S-malonyltransferase